MQATSVPLGSCDDNHLVFLINIKFKTYNTAIAFAHICTIATTVSREMADRASGTLKYHLLNLILMDEFGKRTATVCL